MLPVVLGVLLAFAINNQYELNKVNHKKNEILAHIKFEIAGNFRACEEFIEEQQVRNTFFIDFQDSLDLLASKGLSFRQLPYKGLRMLSLSQTAWDAAQYSGILSSLDFEELQALSGIYQRQELVMDIQNQMVANILDQDLQNPALMKISFFHLKEMKENYMAFAQSLLLNYEHYLNAYASGQNCPELRKHERYRTD